MIHKKFIVRSPAFPLDFFFDANRDSKKGEGELIECIGNVLNNPKFKQAIFFASHDLYLIMPKFLSGEMSKKDALRYSISIFKYISRTSFRSTPFGAFAGIDIGKLEDHSIIMLRNNSLGKLKVRFDTNAENHFLNIILKQSELQDHITFSLNNTIYRVKDHIRYYEKKDNGNRIDYVISSVPAEEHITLLIEKLKTGFSKKDFFELMSRFTDEAEEIQSFFDELVNNCFVLPDLQHYITEKDLLSELLLIFKSAFGEKKDKFTWIQTLIDHVKDFNSGVKDHEFLFEQVNKEVSTTEIKNYFQADLNLDFNQFSLNVKILDKLVVQIRQILSILGYKEKNVKLSRFAQKFQEHFGEREIPLLLAIDPEVGVSYDENEGLVSPLLEGLELYHYDIKVDDYQHHNSAFVSFKNKIAQQSIVNGFTEIVLEDNDLQELKASVGKDPFIEQGDFYVLGSIISSSTEEFDKNNYLFDLNVAVHSSATKLASRFGHLKEEVKAWNKELYRITNESEDGGIVAEIIHLPSYSAGNVLKRPALADYEIPFFAASSVQSDKRIDLSDLYVSVRGQKVVLRSKLLNKTIYPKLTSAHNFRNGIPIYHFLSDLEKQDLVAGMNNIWNIPSGSIYSPRIRFKNLILSKANWKITNADFRGETLKEFENFFMDFTKKYRVPKFVALTHSDNEILLDIDNWVSRRIIYDYLQNKEMVLLTESLQSERSTLINGENGSYCNEVLFQVVDERDKKQKSNDFTITKMDYNPNPLRFFPGDEWLYIKIYSGPKVLDDILIKEISLIVLKLLSEKLVIRFFFIRYSDPDNHLRFRIHCKETDFLYGQCLKHIMEILSPLTEDNTVHKIQFDTYEPELKRYGEEIERSEQVFQADSLLCIKALTFLKEQQLDESFRVYLGVLFMRNYLDDFFNSAQDKYSFCSTMQSAYYLEYSHIPNIKQMLAEKRRYYKDLFKRYEADVDTKSVLNIFNSFIEEKRNMVQQIPFYGSDIDLLKSYIHMSINRLFSEKQRLQELFIYDFVERDFLSVLKSKKI